MHFRLNWLFRNYFPWSKALGVTVKTYAGWPFPQHGTSPQQLGVCKPVAGVAVSPHGNALTLPACTRIHLLCLSRHSGGLPLLETVPMMANHCITWALPPVLDVVGVECGLCTLVVQWSTARFGPTPVHTGCHWWEEVYMQRNVIFSKFLRHPSSWPSILFLPSYWLPGPF